MIYKTKINWNNFKVGEVVPGSIAKELLSHYKRFTDQSILIEVKDEVQKNPNPEIKTKVMEVEKKRIGRASCRERV